MDTLDEVLRLERRLKFDDPLKDVRFTAHVRACPYPVAGYYEVTLSVDSEFLAHRKILLYS